jgi:hypothetical protein
MSKLVGVTFFDLLLNKTSYSPIAGTGDGATMEMFCSDASLSSPFSDVEVYFISGGKQTFCKDNFRTSGW